MQIPTRNYNDPNELNLYEEIRKHMLNANENSDGTLLYNISIYDNDNYIIQSKNKPAIIQKVLISSFFSKQILLNIPNAPQSIRLGLSSIGSEEEWLGVAKLVILPFMLKNGLPK